jgi:hypothetical protein
MGEFWLGFMVGTLVGIFGLWFATSILIWGVDNWFEWWRWGK